MKDNSPESCHKQIGRHILEFKRHSLKSVFASCIYMVGIIGVKRQNRYDPEILSPKELQ